MQKDEEDILEEWIIYHSHLFGLENLYIIDNMSGEASIKILQKYGSKGLYWYQQPDYSKKGDYLYELIKQTKNDCDIAIPLDIDEFIAVVNMDNMCPEYSYQLAQSFLSLDLEYYIRCYPQVKTEAKSVSEIQEHYLKKGFHMKWSPCHEDQLKNITLEERDNFLSNYREIILKHYPQALIACDREQIINHLEQLPKHGRYSFLYYLTSRNGEIDYDDPINEILSFDLVDYEHFDGKLNYNKKFFDPKKLVFLDHGNHHGRVENLSQNQYLNSQLILFHYHHRGARKLIEKCENDIKGLGFVKDLKNIRELREKVKQRVRGSHNIETYLTYLTAGPGSLCMFDDEGITINQLSDTIKTLRDL